MSDPELYARSFADVYDDWYSELDDPAKLVAAVQTRVRRGATILELGSGTGRLAAPLHQQGFRVLALDVSMDMLRAAAAGPLPLAADMACLPICAESVDIVLVAYNTLFNLTSRAAQKQCLTNAAQTLRLGGLLVIEAFVAPALDTTTFAMSTKAHPTDPARRLSILTGPAVTNPEVIQGSHIELGSSTTCRPWQLVYQSTTDLDRVAAELGLMLRERTADWEGAIFTSEADRHVSWYERT